MAHPSSPEEPAQSAQNEASHPAALDALVGEAPASVAAPARVAILLGTLNGERFLEAQLASLEQQSHQNWHLIVSDDGSTDGTLSIVDGFAARVPQIVEVRAGPRRGPAANFLSMAAQAGIDADYFAFCDQDDVWHPDKLRRALSLLQSIGEEKPAAYGGRTRLIDAEGRLRGCAQRFRKAPAFANALAQSIAGGNTIVFNHAAKRLFESTGVLDVVAHDWWAYQLVSGCGGVFLYDDEPYLDYRQHPDNYIGSNRGWRARWNRVWMVCDGGLARWNDRNFAALEKCRPFLTQAASAEFDAYKGIRNEVLLHRLRRFAKTKIRRQTREGNLALLVAVVLNKL